MMTYYDPKKLTAAERLRESLQGLVKVVGFVVAIIVFVIVWQEWQNSRWASHDRMATVQAKGWQTGEYKLCVTVTRSELKYPLLLDCDKSFEHDPKFFNVRFWGPIQQHDKDAAVMMNWKCEKSSEDDPAITCKEETK